MTKGRLWIYAGHFSQSNWSFEDLYRGEMTFVAAQELRDQEDFDFMQVIEPRFGELVVVAEFVREMGWKMKVPV